MDWLEALPKNRRRGSLPRCLLLTQGERGVVAERLTELVGMHGIRVDAEDFWMPQGTPRLEPNGLWDKTAIQEAKLGESAGFLSDEQREEVTNWWLAAKGRANTPNWDIASTCTVAGKRGLLLVEAKAHHAELKSDPKPFDEKEASKGSSDNHDRIGRAIREANAALNREMPGWTLSRDSHYQLANRFAWAWKLSSLGIPVVLVYLGFLCATEMSDQGEPFVDCADWARVVRGHSRNVVPEQAWGRDIKVGSATVTPLIRVWAEEFTV